MRYGIWDVRYGIWDTEYEDMGYGIMGDGNYRYYPVFGSKGICSFCLEARRLRLEVREGCRGRMTASGGQNMFCPYTF